MLHHFSSYQVSDLPRRADVVVIGGGVIGCGVLYHLANHGITDVVLLEKDQLTAGTTWHTAGLVWSLRPNDTEVALLARSESCIWPELIRFNLIYLCCLKSH